MRNPSAVPFALLATIALTACGTGSAKPKLMQSEAGGFEIETPVTLKEETETAPSPIGNIAVHMFTGEIGNRTYVVGYNDYPEMLTKVSSADQLLDGAQEGAAKGVKGKVVESKKITLDGNPGREFVADARYKDKFDATVKARIVLVKNRLYQVLVIGEKGKLTAAEMDPFIESFKLTKK